ncbi:MAG: transporter substrate-binding domain-containing protein [Clostridia bacterium]|nr:transporter substrate-binding domain-containing protein [Clostridia bacterium]
MMKDGTLRALSEKYNVALADVGEASAPVDKIADNGDLAYIKSKGTLVVGITDYKPMDYKDEKGEWIGFDAEFAQAVATKLGVKVEFVEVDWDNKFLELQTKSVDCIWNGMTITDEVKLNTNCTKAYAKNEQVVVVKADKAASIKSVNDLKDLSFAVETGSAGESAAKDNGLKSTAVQTQTNALLEVKAGSVDACIIDSTMADSMLGK